jgi:cyclic pyranopterin phosphate synthase
MENKVLEDTYGRQIRDLRIAVTDRCNYCCFYCKSNKSVDYGLRSDLMSYEEIERVVAVMTDLGVRKVRITGGEPLVRKDIEQLVYRLAQLPDVVDLAMTTNGFLLAERSLALREAGLQRLAISLDSLRPQRFAEITGRDALAKVLRGIEIATEVGFAPIKLNMVVIRGINHDELQDFGHFARNYGHIVRFIEFMPLDEDRQWSKSQVYSYAEILAELGKIGELEPLPLKHAGETAMRFRYADGKGEIGIIASVTKSFCHACSRLRLTADGKLRTCLFSQQDHDILALLRRGISEQDLKAFIREVIQAKPTGHAISSAHFQYPNRSMSLIGG